MRRVDKPTSLATAKARLLEHRKKHGLGPHRASWLADVIWPEAKWVSAQGAGAAASRVLKKLGAYWSSDQKTGQWGWMLIFSDKRAGGSHG